MNRSEFMFALAQLLVDLPFEERSEALKFYNSYFDDAGPENEQHIIEELKSPEAVARSIRAGLDGTMDGGEFREDGFYETFGDTKPMNDVFVRPSDDTKNAGKQTETQGGAGGYYNAEHMYHEPKYHKKGLGKKIALAAVIICALPVLLGVGGGLIGVFFGILGCIIGVIAGIFGGAVGGIFGGIGGLSEGVILCFSNPAEGLATIGAGFFSFAIGILMLMLLVWICTFVVPKVVRWIKKMCQRIFKRRR